MDLEPEVFANSTTYDALNRSISLVSPDNSEIKPTYNEAGLLEQVQARLRGAAEWTRFVETSTTTPKGSGSCSNTATAFKQPTTTTR